ncbi:Gfo/Idh/MocA family oxidoreductase [Actinomadura sp. 7K507]|uniref:Gfo/Idh/MocA family protein n=1 Tax=Actinomadura sp. 7K507 TaxID=2530365 RepID=UPI001404BF98|nr:Gfo/Idh/MocA family oxidoreductase [Actinomadura sp. 7K507]
MVMKVALVGAGRFGALHLHAFRSLPVEVAAVCEPDAERRAAVQEEFGIPAGYAGLDELLERERVDLVDIVSDESTHGELALKAVEAGCHVFVEKPLCMDAAEAEGIRDRARARGVQVVTGQISRFGAGYQHLRDVLDRGELGRPVNLRFRRDFSRSWFPAFGMRVHPVWESGVHDIDLAVWYAGAPCREVYAVQRRVSGLEYPDTLVAVLTFANDVVATVESAWLVPDAAPQTLRGSLELDGTIDAVTELLGDRGTAAYRLAHDGLSVRTDTALAQPELTLWPTVAGRVSGALPAELGYAVEVAAGTRGNDVIPLDEAVEGVRIAAAVQRSAELGVRVTLGN